ncbi:hypothetical protein HID58_012230 [Brassica napus]|uniref:Heat shock 70 kDa protein 17 n=1 Tax=Brassica napus TaxID=3708 RepID=A0ABQ8E0H9_BRANA|nr:hypothetical protein HID58_012230 [Brassica napus]
MSKRKSPSLVAFHSGDRLLGEEAAGITARYPNKVYSQLRDMVGKPFKHVRILSTLCTCRLISLRILEERLVLEIDDGTTVYSVEEALQYGIDKDFANASRHVIFMTWVKDVRWDSGLGGQRQSMEMRLEHNSREKFEELCKDLWERSLTPLKDILKHSGLKMDDIYAVELIGGATRVPKLQSTIQEFIGKQDLDKHLDADEAIVLGSALHAANLSDGIKLKRRLGIVDGSPYGFLVELEGPNVKKDESTKQQLVPRMKKLPSKMFRTFVLDKDLTCHLLMSPRISYPQDYLPVFAQYSVSGLTDATEKYSSRNLSAPIKANLHFSLSRSGVLSLDRGDAVIEITEWVEVPKKNVTIESNTTSTTGNASTGAASDENSQENKEELQADAGNSTAEEPAVVDLGTEKKLKKRTFRIPLKGVVEKTVGPGAPFTKESLAEAKTKLEALDKKDKERRRTAELKNNLESYIYATKEKLETPEFEKISTQEERKAFVEKLDEATCDIEWVSGVLQVQDWLYMDGEDANATEFQERLDSLKAIGSPISLRSDELTARPVAVEYAQKYLTEVKEIIKEWETNKTWLPKEKINEVSKEAEKVKSWLEKNEAEQKKTALWSKPVFTSDEVYAKVFTLQDKVTKVNRIPKPKPKIEKPTKKENATEEKSKGSEDSTNSTESEAAAKEEEGHDEL